MTILASFSHRILAVPQPKTLLVCYSRSFCSKTAFVQGDKPPHPKYTRQYFYYADEHGQLFLDDAKIKNFTSCLKEKVFLDFFTKRLRKNDTGIYEKDFPYISPCGKELNFVRATDKVIVFKSLKDDVALLASHLAIEVGRSLEYGPQGEPYLIWNGDRLPLATID